MKQIPRKNLYESGLLDSVESFLSIVDVKDIDVQSTPFLFDSKEKLDLSKSDNSDAIFIDTVETCDAISLDGNTEEDEWQSFLDDSDLPLIFTQSNQHLRSECNDQNCEGML